MRLHSEATFVLGRTKCYYVRLIRFSALLFHNRICFDAGAGAVGLWRAAEYSAGLVVRGAVGVIAARRRAAPQHSEALEHRWIVEVALEVVCVSAGIWTSKTSPTPRVAQILFKEFLQLVLVLLERGISGKTQAKVESCTHSQRTALFQHLSLTFQTFLLFQLPFFIFLLSIIKNQDKG